MTETPAAAPQLSTSPEVAIETTTVTGSHTSTPKQTKTNITDQEIDDAFAFLPLVSENFDCLLSNAGDVAETVLKLKQKMAASKELLHSIPGIQKSLVEQQQEAVRLEALLEKKKLFYNEVKVAVRQASVEMGQVDVEMS